MIYSKRARTFPEFSDHRHRAYWRKLRQSHTAEAHCINEEDATLNRHGTKVTGISMMTVALAPKRQYDGGERCLALLEKLADFPSGWASKVFLQACLHPDAAELDALLTSRKKRLGPSLRHCKKITVAIKALLP